MHTRKKRIVPLVATALLLTLVSFLVPGPSAPPVAAAPSGSGMVTIPIPSTGSGLTINLVTGETSTSDAFPDGWDVRVAQDMTFSVPTRIGRTRLKENGFVTRLDRRVGGVYNLPLGFEVNTGLPYVQSDSTTQKADSPYTWLYPGDHNYVGVKFWNEDTSAYHHGWIRFCVSADPTFEPRALVEYGYEDQPGTPINVGDGGVGDPSDCGASGFTELTRPFCSLAQDIRSNTIDSLVLEATASCSELKFTDDVDYTQPDSAPWENVTMRGPAGNPVNVKLSGQPATYDLTLRTLTLRDVNLAPEGQWLKFFGSDTGLALDNGSVTFRDSPKPNLRSDSSLTLEAIGGDNVIQALIGNLGSPTMLNAATGATLKFDTCGSLDPRPTVPDSSRCNFDAATNSADINGAILELDDSWVIFNTGGGEMLFHNGGKLLLSTSSSVLSVESDDPSEEGTLRVDGGSIEMVIGSTILGEVVYLNDASADLGAGAEIRVTDLTSVGGDTTVTLESIGGSSARLNSFGLLINENGTLTVAGAGRVEAGQMVLQEGSHVHLTESSSLFLEGNSGPWTKGSIKIDFAANLLIDQDGTAAPAIPIQNDGTFIVRGRLTTGPNYRMSGDGLLRVSGGILGPFSNSNAGSTFTADPHVLLQPDWTSGFAKFQPIIDPTAGQAQKLIANTSFTIDPIGGAQLEPLIINDIVLAPGTQFVIVEYPVGNDVKGVFRRADLSQLRDGDEITFGLNTYQINYNPTNITLTVADPDRVKANDDYYTALQDQTLTVDPPGVRDNDVNVTGDAVLVDPPMHGTVTLNPDGSFTYAPNPGFFGDDSFTYKVGDSNVATVYIHVRAQADCTLSSGYWKTHAPGADAPLDTTWFELPNGPATPFFQSGETYLAVVAKEPEGNPYYILAQQYIAAELNFLRGADPAAVQAEFDAATALFGQYTPAEVEALSPSDPIYQQFVDLAGWLDDYNNGYIGPGYCTQ